MRKIATISGVTLLIVSAALFLMFRKGNANNKIENGWAIDYYSNGKIKSKSLYLNGIQNGPEYVYYDNGKLKYAGNIKNGRRFGDLLWYSKDGNLEQYSAFDINGKDFCDYNYDRFSKVTSINGFLLSTVFYFIDPLTKSVVPLVFRKKYKNIGDLYVTVAIPPNTTLRVSAKINNKRFENLQIKDNVIRIDNPFESPGEYKIFIESYLGDKSGKIVNGINIENTIIKE